MTSYFQDGGHDVISRKASSPPCDIIGSLYALQYCTSSIVHRTGFNSECIYQAISHKPICMHHQKQRPCRDHNCIISLILLSKIPGHPVTVISMTYSPETGAENRLHFSGAGFWYVLSCKSGTDSSGTRNRHRLEHCSISKPETGLRVTEMMIYHLLLFIFVISCKQSVNSRVVTYLFIVIHCLRRLQPRLFLCQKFSFQTYTVWKSGTRKWSRFMAPVSAA